MDDNKKKRPRARRIPEEIRAEKNTDGTQNQLQRPDTVPEASAAQTENAATPAPAAKPVENVPAARVQPRPEVRPTQNAPRPARTLKGESAKNPAQPSAPAEKSTENTAAARVQPRPEVRLIQNGASACTDAERRKCKKSRAAKRAYGKTGEKRLGGARPAAP